MEVDVRIAGGTVHTPGGPVRADVLVGAGKIVGLVGPDEDVSGAEVIDAVGLQVIPGLVDMHAHTRTPGYEYKEDFFTCSQAAAVGGVTTFTDMPNVDPPTDSAELLESKRETAARDCLVDWGHLVSPSRLEEIPKLAAAGATGFKMFQVSGGYPHDPRIAMGEPERVYAAFQAIAATGLHCSVHPFNQPLMDLITEQAFAKGLPRNQETFAEIYTNPVVWSSGVAVLLELQRVTEVRLHLLHSHSCASLELIRDAKARGQRVTCAVDPKYYHLNKEHVAEQGARCAPGGVITEDPVRLAAIWRALDDGTIDTIDSDHAPHTVEDLERFSQDPWTGPFGSPQYEYMLSLVLTDVDDGRISFARAIRLMSENPARIIGVYPRKGAIQIGSDADIVLVDLDVEVRPSDDRTYTKVHWTPYNGWRLKGAPVLTILRGRIIAAEGKVVGERGYGQYLAGTPQKFVDVLRGTAPGLACTPR